MKLVVATKNKGKLREIAAILPEYEVVSMEDMGIDLDVTEDGSTFEENARKKAETIQKLCGEITLADDSGLVVEALGGAPGIYSARYSGEGATDEKNNQKLLQAMEGIENRTAKFVCVLALCFPNGTVQTFEGEFHGQVHHQISGSGGFGYDVVFYLPQYGKTSAEIPSELKNRISHRAIALQKLKEYLGGKHA